MTYAHALAPILSSVDIKTVRLQLVTERERQGLNQRELAAKAGIDQGHLSKIEDVDGQEMRDLAARIVFQLIEDGLQLPVSEFFRHIEGGAEPATISGAPLPTGQADADEPLTPSSEDLEQAWDAIGTLARIAERERERADRAHRRSATDSRVTSEAERPPHRVRSRPRPRKRKPSERRKRER